MKKSPDTQSKGAPARDTSRKTSDSEVRHSSQRNQIYCHTSSFVHFFVSLKNTAPGGPPSKSSDFVPARPPIENVWERRKMQQTDQKPSKSDFVLKNEIKSTKSIDKLICILEASPDAAYRPPSRTEESSRGRGEESSRGRGESRDSGRRDNRDAGRQPAWGRGAPRGG